MGWRHGEENIREADWETACLKFKAISECKNKAITAQVVNENLYQP